MFITFDIISVRHYFPFDNLSRSAFVTFDLMSFRHYFPFDVISVDVFYFNVLSVNLNSSPLPQHKDNYFLLSLFAFIPPFFKHIFSLLSFNFMLFLLRTFPPFFVFRPPDGVGHYRYLPNIPPPGNYLLYM
jgi:hypothetical protein